jgi:AraC-like DNA-binding protein
LSFINSFAQNHLSLSEKEFIYLQDKVREQTNGNIDSAFIYADRIERSNSFYHKTFAVGAKSYLFQINGDSISSNKFFEKALYYFSKTPNSIEKKRLNTFLYTYRGLTYWKRGRLNDALIEYQKGKKISESINDKIQTIKFNNNIANINSDVGNFKLAIKSAKESDALTTNIELLYTKNQFLRNKSNINLNLGNYYERLYSLNRHKKKYLDSAQFYFEKSILYSNKQINNKLIAQTNLANIFYLKKNYYESEKQYLSSLIIAKDNDLSFSYCNISHNLGDLYFSLKEYKKALIYLKNVDSIHKIKKTNVLEYINSNYLQAIIYDIFDDTEKAILHSKLYLKSFEQNQMKNQKELLKVNHNLLTIKTKKEIESINQKHKNKKMKIKGGILISIILIFSLLYFLIKNNNEKNKAQKKIDTLIAEFKTKNNTIIITKKNKEQKSPYTLSIDDEKEIEIIDKLEKLEKKLYFLNPEFNLQTASKKIKTNTTYLSYVVNKKLEKTFSEYSNELRINYVINELINNKTYRKYSTQAIAESVGFKSSVSFSKSFKKRTGFTPIQFINKLDSDNSI